MKSVLFQTVALKSYYSEYELKDVLRWSKKVLQEKIQKTLTVYDSTGLAIEDIAIAEAIYEKIK